MSGVKLGGDHIRDILKSLKANNVLGSYTHILTGYLGTADFGREVANVIDQVREANPDVVYVCDPVLGDFDENNESKLYVPEELVAVYKDLLIPRASLITPNEFELATLTGRKSIGSEREAVAAADELHAIGPKHVVVTSMHFGHSKPSTLAVLASGPGGGSAVHRIDVPYFDFVATGAGDVTAALLLAWTQRQPNNLALAVKNAVSSLSALIGRTYKAYAAKKDQVKAFEALRKAKGKGWVHADPAAARGGPSEKRFYMELKLVQSLQDFLTPPEIPGLREAPVRAPRKPSV